MKSQQETNDSQIIINDFNSIFKWVIGGLVTILFAFIALIYASLTTKDTSAETDIKQNTTDISNMKSLYNLRFQNLEANVYLLCKSQRTDCIPPIK